MKYKWQIGSGQDWVDGVCPPPPPPEGVGVSVTGGHSGYRVGKLG